MKSILESMAVDDDNDNNADDNDPAKGFDWSLDLLFFNLRFLKIFLAETQRVVDAIHRSAKKRQRLNVSEASQQRAQTAREVIEESDAQQDDNAAKRSKTTTTAAPSTTTPTTKKGRTIILFVDGEADYVCALLVDMYGGIYIGVGDADVVLQSITTSKHILYVDMPRLKCITRSAALAALRWIAMPIVVKMQRIEV